MTTLDEGRTPSAAATKESPADGDLELARDAVKRVFSLLGIKKVVVVDDELERGPSFAEFVAKYAGLRGQDSADAAEFAEFKGIERSATLDDVREGLQEVWDRLTETEQQGLLARMGWSAEPGGFMALRKVLADYDLVVLSLQEWKTQEKELTTPEQLAATLYLFDLDMSKDGGAENEGMRIIRGLLDATRGKCQCGLLSHLVPMDSEYESWQGYAEEHEVVQYRSSFVVISKTHLPETPMVFAQRLKRAAISHLCNEVRSEVGTVFDNAFKEAKGELEKLNVYDFEEIVFQSSHVEGVWEPDTILRILALYTQRSARRLLKANVRVEEVAAHIRTVVDIGFRPEDAPAASSRDIIRMENYEDVAFLCDHHIPIDLGDIFKKTSGKGEFILLAQPCDIMCRNAAGKRPEEVLLAPVVELSKGTQASNLPPGCWELDHYATEPTKVKYADFRNARPVPILALDLTVFDAEGKSRFRVDSSCPDQVTPSWRRRHAQINTEVNTIVNRYTGAGGKDTKEAKGDSLKLAVAALTRSVSGFLQGNIDVSAATVSYEIQRISRLKAPRSGALLRAFMSFVARDGFDHDLARTVSQRKSIG